jgi:hypothetical protein
MEKRDPYVVALKGISLNQINQEKNETDKNDGTLKSRVLNPFLIDKVSIVSRHPLDEKKSF